MATFSSLDPDAQSTQNIITRYFFSQFWCEFTKEVLTEFLNEDFLIKEMQAEQNHKKQMKKPFENDDFESDEDLSSIRRTSSRRRKSQGPNKLKMQKDGSVRLSNEVHNQITKQ